MAVSGDGVRLQSPSSSVPPTITVRSRGTTYVGPVASTHQLVEIDAVHHDDLAAHRPDILVPRETASAETGAVDHDTSSLSGSELMLIRVSVPPSSVSRSLNHCR